MKKHSLQSFMLNPDLEHSRQNQRNKFRMLRQSGERGNHPFLHQPSNYNTRNKERPASGLISSQYCSVAAQHVIYLLCEVESSVWTTFRLIPWLSSNRKTVQHILWRERETNIYFYYASAFTVVKRMSEIKQCPFKCCN